MDSWSKEAESPKQTGHGVASMQLVSGEPSVISSQMKVFQLWSVDVIDFNFLFGKGEIEFGIG